MSGTSQRRAVFAALAIYAAGFGLFQPNALMVSDEAYYVGQAVLFSQGRVTADARHPQTGALQPAVASTYPVGTSLLQLPFVKLGGWRAAPLTSLACLVGAVLLLMRWLESERRSPLFALLLLAYPPALVLGRVGMSDVPSALVVLSGWVLFWAGLRGHRWAWLGAGFVAGASVLWREPNVLFFVPLFAGALLRRERATWQLVVGGLSGLSLRVLSAWWLFGDAFYYRSPASYGFLTATLWNNLAVYLFALLAMVPLGLVGLALYRGERRVELIATGLLVFAFYAVYGYGGQDSGRVKQLILGPRFFIPLVPLLAFALAESLPRWWARAASWLEGRAALTAALILIALEILGVHAVLHRWGKAQASMQQAIDRHVPEGSTLVVNMPNVGKFASPAYGRRFFIDRGELPVEGAGRLTPFHVVIIERTDSEFRLQELEESRAWLEALQARCDVRPQYDRQETAIERLRIYEVPGCSAPSVAIP